MGIDRPSTSGTEGRHQTGLNRAPSHRARTTREEASWTSSATTSTTLAPGAAAQPLPPRPLTTGGCMSERKVRLSLNGLTPLRSARLFTPRIPVPTPTCRTRLAQRAKSVTNGWTLLSASAEVVEPRCPVARYSNSNHSTKARPLARVPDVGHCPHRGRRGTDVGRFSRRGHRGTSNV